jgi:photosystem I P700 chlorophyll a apoprotein A1
MTISSPEREAKKVKIAVDRNPVETSFEKWAKPGHFSRSLAKGPNTTTWIWNLHADAHDFDSHTSDLEDISRKVFSAHFGQLGIILIWLSGGDTSTWMPRRGAFYLFNVFCFFIFDK